MGLFPRRKPKKGPEEEDLLATDPISSPLPLPQPAQPLLATNQTHPEFTEPDFEEEEDESMYQEDDELTEVPYPRRTVPLQGPAPWPGGDEEEEFDEEEMAEEGTWESMSKEQQEEIIMEMIEDPAYIRSNGSVDCTAISNALGGVVSPQKVNGVNLKLRRIQAQTRKTEAMAKEKELQARQSELTFRQKETALRQQEQMVDELGFSGMDAGMSSGGSPGGGVPPMVWLQNMREERQHREMMNQQQQFQHQQAQAQAQQQQMMNQQISFMQTMMQQQQNMVTQNSGMFGNSPLGQAFEGRLVDMVADGVMGGNQSEKPEAIQWMEAIKESGLIQEAGGLIRDLRGGPRVDPGTDPYASQPQLPAPGQPTQAAPQPPQQTPKDAYKVKLLELFKPQTDPRYLNDLAKQIEITVEGVLAEPVAQQQPPQQLFEVMRMRLLFVTSARDIGTMLIQPISKGAMTIPDAVRLASKKPQVAQMFAQASYDQLMSVLRMYEGTYVDAEIRYFSREDIRRVCESLMAGLRGEPVDGPPAHDEMLFTRVEENPAEIAQHEDVTP